MTEGRGIRKTIVRCASKVLSPQSYSIALQQIHPPNRRVVERVRGLSYLICRIPEKAVVVIKIRGDVEGADSRRFHIVRAQVHCERRRMHRLHPGCVDAARSKRSDARRATGGSDGWEIGRIGEVRISTVNQRQRAI